MARRSAALAAVAMALSGCGGEIPGKGYPGDPFVTFSGTVSSTRPLWSIQMVLQWQKGDAPALWPAVTGARRDHDPLADPDATQASFELPIYYPPPLDAPSTPPSETIFKSLHAGEVPIARGNVAAVPYGYPDALIEKATREQDRDYGADVHHWIVFTYGAIPGDSVTAWWTGTLGTGLAPGFHLLEVMPFNPACMTPSQLERCVADLVDLDVEDDGTAAPGTARGFCMAPFRLRPATSLETDFQVLLGTYGLPDPGACP